MFLTLIVCWWSLLISTVQSTTEFHGTPKTLSNTVSHFIEDRPSAFIMDNRKLSSYLKHWGKLRIPREMGSTFFVYKGFLEDNRNTRVKPYPWRSNYRYNIAFGWTFICLLEVTYSEVSLEKYLQKLLLIGNGRTDKFIFMGGQMVLRHVLKNSLMRKFRNVIGIEINGFSVMSHYRKTCRNSGENEPFAITDDYSMLSWVPHRENCLSGHHFRMAGTDFPPFMYYHHRPEESKRKRWKYDGINYLVIENGARAYNYSFTLNDPEEWELMGEKLENGTWDGIFGDLVYGRTEIISVSSPTEDRNGLADFIGPFGRSNLVFMSANPVTYANAGEYAVFHPLPYYVWIVIICGFFLLWVLNSVALEIRYCRGQDRYKDTIHRAFLMMMAFTFEQGFRKPKGVPLKLLMIVWVSFMIIMATSYRYNLASYIVKPQPDEVPSTFHDLYDHDEYRIIFDLGGVSGWNYFQTSQDPKIKALVNRATKTEDTSWCTVTAFMEVSTVCAGWDFSLTFASSKNLSITLDRRPLYTSQPIFEAWFVFATENNSVFTSEFMRIGRAYFEIGLTLMWEAEIVRKAQYRGRKWLSEYKNSSLYEQLVKFRTRSSRNILEKLNWSNVQFIFLIFILGIVMSSITFVAELFQAKKDFIKRYLNRRKIKIRKISNIVRRKISGEIIPTNAVISHQEKIALTGGTQNPTITVTFLP